MAGWAVRCNEAVGGRGDVEMGLAGCVSEWDPGKNPSARQEIGYVGLAVLGPSQSRIWARQLCVWMCVICTTKTYIVIVYIPYVDYRDSLEVCKTALWADLQAVFSSAAAANPRARATV